jgi:hypothetical protein
LLLPWLVSPTTINGLWMACFCGWGLLGLLVVLWLILQAMRHVWFALTVMQFLKIDFFLNKLKISNSSSVTFF